MENYPNVDVTLGTVSLADGTLLRTIRTAPHEANGKLPAVFFVGWLSCDSIESPTDSDGFATLIRTVVQRSGMITFRVDKPGTGDSEGDCAKTDFATELAGYRAAFAALASQPEVDRDRIFMIGLSNGGGFEPLVPQGPIRGYVSVSGWGTTWYEHMLQHERLRLQLSGKQPAEISRQMQQFSTLYDEYLNQQRTPAEVIAAHPDFKQIWYDNGPGQYGRPAIFYQQLQALNLAQAWMQVTVPVLVIRGTYDWVMSNQDASAISEAVNAAHPGLAQYREFPMAHNLNHYEGMAASFRAMKAPFEIAVADSVFDFLRKLQD